MKSKKVSKFYPIGERRPVEALRGSVARCVDSTASVNVTWEVESDEELGALADAAMSAAERACDSIDDALAFVAASVKRFAAMEAQAAVEAFDPALKGQI